MTATVTTRFVFAWSRHQAEEGQFHLVEARNEKEARRLFRARFNLRSTRGVFVAEAAWFDRELVRLVALNEQGTGVVRHLDGRRKALAALRAA